MAVVRPIDANALIEELRKHKGQFPADGNEPFMCWEVEGYINDQETLTQTIETPAFVVWKERYRGGFEHNVTIVDEMGTKHVGTLDTRRRTKTPYCSACGGELGVSSLNYCPNCGAKMEVQDGQSDT